MRRVLKSNMFEITLVISDHGFLGISPWPSIGIVHVGDCKESQNLSLIRQVGTCTGHNHLPISLKKHNFNYWRDDIACSVPNTHTKIKKWQFVWRSLLMIPLSSYPYGTTKNRPFKNRFNVIYFSWNKALTIQMKTFFLSCKSSSLVMILSLEASEKEINLLLFFLFS